MAEKPRFIVVGGGLAGLMTVIKIAEAGQHVDLFSVVPVKRSHSVCAQGGINGAVNTKGEGDTPWEHFDDSIYGGDFLADQPPVQKMCEAAPGIIYMFDRMGVMFNRTSEGLLDFRRFGGTKHHRTAFAGATTGQQLLYALDEQVRRYEVAGLVTKYEGWEFIGYVPDDAGQCRGAICQQMVSGKIQSFRSDAVILATGGPGLIFGRSTNSTINTGSAASAAYQQGAWYANGEFIQVHPTAIPGEDKLRLMSESIRGEGGRVWVPSDGKEGRPPVGQPWYFLEAMYPAYGNLVPRDIATRAIFKICRELGLGIDGKDKVYLDVTHIPVAVLNAKLEGVMEIYEKFVGQDPRKVPMQIFPAVHYSMGGLWVDYPRDDGQPHHWQMTNVPGLFAVGECEFGYHGANRLGANSLLSTVFAGMMGGPDSIKFVKAQESTAAEASQSIFDREMKRHDDFNKRLLALDGPENPFQLHAELGDLMTGAMTVVRYNDKLKAALTSIASLRERFWKITLTDKGAWMNQPLHFSRQLHNMLILAEAMTLGALQRDESRGAHYKPDFPERDDARFLKTTLAQFTPEGPKLSYMAVDTSLITPRARKYDVDKKGGDAETKAAALTG
ncbi:MAG: succinate dehydrogenase flavoprotein subunit [Candidatus Eisenbacteria bacterium]|nr:succinate dehydrogenase flavoprotein subunit [Candidatus Eisenbacteria bacterium]